LLLPPASCAVFSSITRERGAAPNEAAKCGKVNLDAALLVATELDPELVRLDEALEDLAVFDARKARVVELRYFGGPTSQEAAAVCRSIP
jgi:hypothetical protein